MVKYVTNEHGGYSCYVCIKSQPRVIEIPESPHTYYCEACLFTAIRDGVIELGVAKSVECDSCGSEDESWYCSTCYGNATSTCNSCGYSEEVYCNDCFWEDHDCTVNISCNECGRYGIDFRCERCLTVNCTECGEEIVASEMVCTECSTKTPEVVVSDDGREFTLDDGVVINWGG